MPGNSTNHAKPGSQENSMRNERTFMQVRAKIIELENLLGGLHSEEMQYISRTMQDKDFRLKTRLTILTLDFFYLFNKKGKQFEWLKEGKLIHWWRKFSSLKDESDREIVKEMTQNWKEPNEETKLTNILAIISATPENIVLPEYPSPCVVIRHTFKIPRLQKKKPRQNRYFADASKTSVESRLTKSMERTLPPKTRTTPAITP